MKWVSKMTKAPDPTVSDTRFRILIVAERLFAEIGFRKATVNDIARELRMSPANVYRFYGSKSDINASVVAKLLSEMEVGLADIVKRSEPARQKLRAFLGAIEKTNSDRFHSNKRLHELVETAFSETGPSCMTTPKK
jgi:AcrR family transcriptional regulator